MAVVLLSLVLAFVSLYAVAVTLVCWAFRHRSLWVEQQLWGFISRETRDPTRPWPPAGTTLDEFGGVVWPEQAD